MTATEMAKHFRSQLKAAGIKARCRVTPGGSDAIQVFVPQYGATFADHEQRTIRAMAVEHGLTWVRGLPINVDQMTNPHDMNFFL